LNKEVIYNNQDLTYSPIDIVKESKYDFDATFAQNDDNLMKKLSSFKGTFFIGYDSCIFSINKANLHPIRVNIEKHEIKKIQQQAEDKEQISPNKLK